MTIVWISLYVNHMKLYSYDSHMNKFHMLPSEYHMLPYEYPMLPYEYHMCIIWNFFHMTLIGNIWDSYGNHLKINWTESHESHMMPFFYDSHMKHITCLCTYKKSSYLHMSCDVSYHGVRLVNYFVVGFVLVRSHLMV